MEREHGSRYEEVEGDESKKAASRKPDIGMRSARRFEISSDADSTGEIFSPLTYNSASAPIAVMKVTNPTKWQEFVNVKWKEYSRTGLQSIRSCTRSGYETKGNDAFSKIR